jgi:hypothetical protein
MSSGRWFKRLHNSWLDSDLVDFLIAIAILLMGAYLFGGWPYVAVGGALVLLIGIVAGALFVFMWLVVDLDRWLNRRR